MYDRQAANILDGDYITFWYLHWSDADSDPARPHYLTVDIGEKLSVEAPSFYGGKSQRMIKDLEIQVRH